MRQRDLQQALIVGALALGLVSCSPGETSKTSANGHTDNGRFQFVQGTAEMPAVLVDTRTGCIETFDEWTLDPPKKNGTKSVFIRSKSDEVVEGTPKRCGGEGANK